MSSEIYQSCIAACRTCAERCDACLEGLRSDPNPQMMSRCSGLCMDCAAMCRLAIAYMTRESEFTDLICQDCAEVCMACAEECHEYPMAHCQDCAAACTECAEECLRMGTSPLRPGTVVGNALGMGARM